MNRRGFLSWATAGAAALLATGAAWAIAFVRFLFPSVYYEPPERFKIGIPADFPLDTPTFLPGQKIYVFRDRQKGFSCVSGVCTHLGCTINWSASDHRFHCPCHGSVFDRDGHVVSGPAPRALEWLEVSLAKDGRLVVDKGRVVPPTYNLIAGRGVPGSGPEPPPPASG